MASLTALEGADNAFTTAATFSNLGEVSDDHQAELVAQKAITQNTLKDHQGALTTLNSLGALSGPSDHANAMVIDARMQLLGS